MVKIKVKCQNPECGKTLVLKRPEKPGTYKVKCPECGTSIAFKITAPASSDPQAPQTPEAAQPQQPQPQQQPQNPQQPQQPQNPQPQPQQPQQAAQQKYGFLEDGSYRYICDNPACKKSVKVPANMVKVGLNKQACPVCGHVHEYEKEAPIEEMLKCQNSKRNCQTQLPNPLVGLEKNVTGKYRTYCPQCGHGHTVIVEDGKVREVRPDTIKIKPGDNTQMKLVVGSFLCKKEYLLRQGTNYVGRHDAERPSDFMVKDEYASARSLRIDVRFDSGSSNYKVTVERASNPVYHNNIERKTGDILYLNYGDTIKIGKTLIKVQKVNN